MSVTWAWNPEHNCMTEGHTHLPEELCIGDKGFLECFGDTLGIHVLDVRTSNEGEGPTR